ncbi:MAG: VOC family protein [Candidatus Binataceae bacterium]|nr:VOC family protein [Candidatus Binataceae bacterium]
MVHPERLGHLILKVRDLEPSRRFYTEVLGLDLMFESKRPKMALFASHRRDHHEIGLIEVGAQAGSPKPSDIGLYHIAFRLKDEDEVRAAYHELKAKQVPIAFTVHHGLTKSVYFNDPDGYLLEFYCDVSPEEMANYPDLEQATAKLEFAPDDPGLLDHLAAFGAMPGE